MQVSRKSAASLVEGCPSGSCLLFVSPHYDDVAFSCSGLIHHLVMGGFRVVWATVFSSGRPLPCGFALQCQTSKGIAREIDYMRLRRAEDQRCAALLGLEGTVELGLPEAPNRGYRSARMLFRRVRPGDARDTVRRISIGLERLMRQLSAFRVIAPLGLGGHVDHILVSRAAKQAIPTRRLLQYADNPYLMQCRRADLAACAFGMEAYLFDVGPYENTRAAAYACYESQLGFQLRSIGSVQDFARKSARHAGDLCRVSLGAEIYFRPQLSRAPNLRSQRRGV